MSIFLFALALGLTVPLTYIVLRKLYPGWVKKQAQKKLESRLFPQGNRQKAEVLKTFRNITGERFSDEDILEYFFKIKGLQAVDINTRTNYWVKKYLFSPTSIKLNYFEQVKFYETFLNFPVKPGVEKRSFFKPEKFAREKIKTNRTEQMSKHLA
jgi:hypothetical protein